MSGQFNKILERQHKPVGLAETGEDAIVELERLRQCIADLERCQAEGKEREKKLKQSEELYRNLVEGSQDLIFQCDRHGRFTFVNKAWEDTLGFRVDELLRHRISELQAPGAAQRDLRAGDLCLGDGRGAVARHTDFVAGYGSACCVPAQCHPIARHDDLGRRDPRQHENNSQK
jgi:PAS domain S-box-containing protein